MKRTFLIILFIFFSKFTSAQIYEAGVLVGASNFIGDVGSDYYILPNAPAGGLILKYNVNPRIALRFNFMHIGLKGDDKRSDNSFREQRNVNFSNGLAEISFGTEFNFFEYTLTSIYTPYILTQVSAFQYKTSNRLENRELRTKSNIALAIPVGLGFKGRITGELAYAIEGGVRFTFKDDLDYTNEKIEPLNFGGQGDDHYMFVGVSLVYTFGRPACYAERK